jgi:hypothetical protein
MPSPQDIWQLPSPGDLTSLTSPTTGRPNAPRTPTTRDPTPRPGGTAAHRHVLRARQLPDGRGARLHLVLVQSSNMSLKAPIQNRDSQTFRRHHSARLPHCNCARIESYSGASIHESLSSVIPPRAFVSSSSASTHSHLRSDLSTMACPAHKRPPGPPIVSYELPPFEAAPGLPHPTSSLPGPAPRLEPDAVHGEARDARS